MPSPVFAHSRYGKLFAILLAALLGVACSDGDDGAAGPPGPPGPGTSSAADSLTFTLDGITIASPPVVDFTLTNEDGVPYTGLLAGEIRFIIAKLVPAANGNASYWQSYINRTEGPDVGPGTETTIQANTESNGTLVNNLDGSYRYTFANDITNMTTPLAVTYEPSLTHRLAVQIGGGDTPVANATYDWRPSDGATTGLTTRDIVQTASCNECHTELALHGGGRKETKYCVTCHNPGSTDANSTNTVDFKVMIHKIHYSEHLPSVEAGGEYAIWGFRDTKHDYSDVTYPQDVRNCTKCHDPADAATPDADNFATAPTAEACGSCHDDVNFVTGENHSDASLAATNAECTGCHMEGGVAGSVTESHVVPVDAESARFAYSIVSVTNTAPGEFPVVTYRVTDPTNGDAAYDLTAGPEWTTLTGGVSRLAIDLGWDTDDYHNEGNGSSSTPASPVSLNALGASSGNNAAPVDNGDGTFTVTSLRAVPDTVTGSGVAALEGHPAADYDGDGVFTDRVPVKTAIEYFPITDATAVERREVVDIDKCNLCHERLSLHGSNRTDEPRVCVICHNANNTDVGRRGGATGIDGKFEESIDFKYMIHAIHAAGVREDGIVVYGFGGTPNDFSHITFPGIVNNCSICHVDDAFTLPLASEVLATTVDSGASIPDPSDDANITPTAAVCSSCHDSDIAGEHMELNGASFMALQSQVDDGTFTETCSVCHGPGRLADVSEVHPITP